MTQALNNYFISYPFSLIKTDEYPVHYLQLIRNYMKKRVDLFVDIKQGNIESRNMALKRSSQTETTYSGGI